MTAVAVRQFTTRLFDGQVDQPQDATTLVDSIDDYIGSQPLLPILLGYLSGDVNLPDSSVVTLPLPDSYVSTGILLSVLRFTGPVTIALTSPVFSGTKTIYGQGTATQNGVFAFQGQVTAITVTNPQGSTIPVTVDYFFLALPDITLPASFRGIQTTGLMSEVPA